MSSPVALAAVTATLAGIVRGAVDRHMTGTKVTTVPPAEAAHSADNCLNLFLYQVTLDASLTNLDWSPVSRQGEPVNPALALVLHYLVTPFVSVRSPGEPVDEMLLGYAMSALHDHAVLSAADVRTWLARPDNDLDRQVDRVRVTLEPLSIDDLSRLWTTFQAGYRLSAGYQAGVVLIDAAPSVSVPLPVLKVGSNDEGAEIVAAMPPAPVIEEVAVVDGPIGGIAGTTELVTQGSWYSTRGRLATPGDTLLVSGQLLDGSHRLRFTTPAGQDITVLLTPDAVTSSRVRVQLPADLEPTGVHTIAMEGVSSSGAAWVSETVPLAVGPRVTEHVVADGQATLSVSLQPRVSPTQFVRLLLGSAAVEPEPFADPTSTLTFRLPQPVSGTVLSRVRVDRLDSMSFNVVFP